MKILRLAMAACGLTLAFGLGFAGCADDSEDDFFAGSGSSSGGGGSSGGAFTSQSQCQTDDPETVYWADRTSNHVASQLAAFCAIAAFDHCLLVEFGGSLPEDPTKIALRGERDANRQIADQFVQQTSGGSGFDCAQAPTSLTCDDVFYTSSGLTCWGASSGSRATSPPGKIN